jgi:hypothetical protein
MNILWERARSSLGQQHESCARHPGSIPQPTVFLCTVHGNEEQSSLVQKKDEHPMPIVNMLINDASGHQVISFLDDNAGYNQIFMAKEDMSKTAFIFPRFVGLFEWVVMIFGLKNASATYQRTMNLIFHDLIGVIIEVYIDDIVIKSATHKSHLADLRLAFERMRHYGLKMNPLECAFGVSA